MTRPVVPALPPDAGDPGSLSAAAGTLHRVATVLRADAEATRAAYAVLVDEVRLPLPQRKAADAFGADAEGLAEALEIVVGALQDYATEAAELAARLRLALGRVDEGGWRLDGGAVVPGWGISGAADPSLEAGRAADQAALQGELDAVRVLLARRRDRLLVTLDSTRPTVERVRSGARG